MTTVRASVRVTLEIEVSDSWGPDCSMGQVESQATSAALGAIARGVTIGGRPGSDTDPKTRGWATVIGTPEVIAIVTPTKKPGT